MQIAPISLGSSGKPVVGTRAGRGRHGLDRVQAVHALGLLGTPAGREVARVAKRARSAAEKVGVEREDDVRPIEAVLRVDVLAERELAPARAFSRLAGSH